AAEPGDELGDDRILIGGLGLSRLELGHHGAVAAGALGGVSEFAEGVVGALDDDADRVAQILLGRRGREEFPGLLWRGAARPDAGPRSPPDEPRRDALEI